MSNRGTWYEVGSGEGVTDFPPGVRQSKELAGPPHLIKLEDRRSPVSALRQGGQVLRPVSTTGPVSRAPLILSSPP